ncbi:hypothetical protein MPSEU_000730800 [Mayamaea pseudoterrestris]|nr:hypothetical protein MPSEU_000730800 [Mayamaea pseudoterrestris]
MRGLLDLSKLFIVVAVAVSGWNLYVGFRYGLRERREEKWSASFLTAPFEETKSTSSKASNAFESIIAREPTHHACDGFDGIYHIAMTDILGGVGTGLLQLVVNQIDYARRHNLKPWVHLNNSSHVIYDPIVHSRGSGVQLKAMRAAKATYVKRPGGHWRDAVPGPPNLTSMEPERDFTFDGTGVWEHYFDPVSDFVPGDVSCEHKLLVSMDLYLITPGLHGYSDYATRCWRYDYLPEYITKPHIPYDSWLYEQRLRAHDVMQNYVRLKPDLLIAAKNANPDCSLQEPCLGLHIRHSDKAAGRRVLETSQFLPYAQSFADNGGKHIYLATDSAVVLNEIRDIWPASIARRIRRMGDNTVRSSNQQAVFDMASHHQTNQEALIEILALSQCQYMVHGLSAVSESSIWINMGLHNRSINLEDPEHVDAASFGSLVRMSLAGHPEDQWPHATRTSNWWNVDDTSLIEKRLPRPNECLGYDGILLISAVSHKSSTASAFFIDVLNQLLYAKRNNLKPWIHLQDGTVLIQDQKAHTNKKTTNISVKVTNIGFSKSRPVCPNNFDSNAVQAFTVSNMSLRGNGIWNSYFLPILTPPEIDSSCSELPVVTMEERLVSPLLTALCPYSVKAWRYDNVPYWKPNDISLHEWHGQMRRTAHDIVSRNFIFRHHIVQRATDVNSVESGSICLGVHIRVGDKAGTHVKKIKADQYLPYMKAFQRAGGQSIYLASDSHRAIQYVIKSLPKEVAKFIRTQGSNVVRTYKEYPTHFLDDHHRDNSEALVDILALSKCSLMLHSYSTVSEAAIYLNINLNNHSVNLEVADCISPERFETHVKDLINSKPSVS